MKLLIVESPAKVRKIQGYLGAGWQVRACLGHVRDLPVKGDTLPEKYNSASFAQLGVDVEHDYAPPPSTLPARTRPRPSRASSLPPKLLRRFTWLPTRVGKGKASPGT